MRTVHAALLGSAMLFALCASADEPKQALSVTVYNDNLALVQDARALNVAAGRSRIEFKDVSASIKPETVALSGKGLSVVEQNFDYDLLTPSKMMEKAVGHQVQIIRTNPNGSQTRETATVLSVNEGVVLRIGNRIEVLRDDGIPTRVIFDSIPENLRASPTLSVTVDAAQGGERETMLSYLTTGLSWKADYVALFDEKTGQLKFQGWVTLKNSSGTTYRDARTQLVAGDINLSDSEQTYERRNGAGNGTGSSANAIADYHIYTLPERVTIADNQTKQVGFLDLNGASAKKVYRYTAGGFYSNETPLHADVDLGFNNADRALPAGIVRVYMRDADGEPKFVGEDDIGHTPAGSDVSIHLGSAFDVSVQPSVVSTEKTGKTGTRYKMSYIFRNAQPAPVTVEFQQGGLGRDAEVEHESLKSRRINANTLGWSVSVPANGKTELTFTVTSGD